MVNASLVPDQSSLLLHRSINLGVAMATPHGLAVPNIKDVQASFGVSSGEGWEAVLFGGARSLPREGQPAGGACLLPAHRPNSTLPPHYTTHPSQHT